MPKWIKKWTVESFTDPEKTFTVSLADDGITWGCACWPWRKSREDCKHILYVKDNSDMKPRELIDPELPAVVPCKGILKPINDKNEKTIFVPLIPLEPYDVHMEATICYFLIEHGFTITKVRAIRSLCSTWTKKAIVDIIKTKGMKEYKLNSSDSDFIPKSTIERFMSLDI